MDSLMEFPWQIVYLLVRYIALIIAVCLLSAFFITANRIDDLSRRLELWLKPIVIKPSTFSELLKRVISKAALSIEYMISRLYGKRIDGYFFLNTFFIALIGSSLIYIAALLVRKYSFQLPPIDVEKTNNYFAIILYAAVNSAEKNIRSIGVLSFGFMLLLLFSKLFTLFSVKKIIFVRQSPIIEIAIKLTVLLFGLPILIVRFVLSDVELFNLINNVIVIVFLTNLASVLASRLLISKIVRSEKSLSRMLFYLALDATVVAICVYTPFIAINMKIEPTQACLLANSDSALAAILSFSTAFISLAFYLVIVFVISALVLRITILPFLYNLSKERWLAERWKTLLFVITLLGIFLTEDPSTLFTFLKNL